MNRRLVLYGRPDCHLCDEARTMLTPMIAAVPDIHMTEVNIESDERLHREYLERIPVVMLDDVVVSELVPDAERLRATLLKGSAR
ncbi:glutaredoxin family protein [soil metagenome]